MFSFTAPEFPLSAFPDPLPCVVSTCWLDPLASPQSGDRYSPSFALLLTFFYPSSLFHLFVTLLLFQYGVPCASECHSNFSFFSQYFIDFLPSSTYIYFLRYTFMLRFHAKTTLQHKSFEFYNTREKIFNRLVPNSNERWDENVDTTEPTV